MPNFLELVLNINKAIKIKFQSEINVAVEKNLKNKEICLTSCITFDCRYRNRYFDESTLEYYKEEKKHSQ